MNSLEAGALNDFLTENWTGWCLFCESKKIDPYSDVFSFEGNKVEIPDELENTS